MGDPSLGHLGALSLLPKVATNKKDPPLIHS